MKLILLRHEERSFDVTFYSELVDDGIIRACTSLVGKLENIHIDAIFSSPFIRTLQTIYPYASKYNRGVNVEYGLYEYIHNPAFLIVPWYRSIDEIHDTSLQSIINRDYSSIVKKSDFNILENEIDLERRIIKFFNYLLQNYKDKTVLLVTHKGVINKIKDLYIKRTEMNDEFDMGHIEVYNIL